MQNQTFKLTPIDGRKTMNNQHVNRYTLESGEEYSDLISYTTRVASYNHKTKEVAVYNCQSQTTIRHIKAFLYFYGFGLKNSNEIKKMCK